MNPAAVMDNPAVNSVVILLLTAVAVWVGINPLIALVRRRQASWGYVLRNTLLMNVSPAGILLGWALCVLVPAGLAMLLLGGSLTAAFIAALLGALLPGRLIRLLRKRRLQKLEEQLVSGIQTLASGVRAGLNLVQSMQLVARDGPAPLSQEFAHLVREYEYGMPLDEAMDNASRRIGSADYRLLLAALKTHRQRGGNLGETLDRIAASIREIQRLESRVQSLTAQGRATARWLGAMPAVVVGILYLIEPAGVVLMLTTGIGKAILGLVIILNVIGFLWIRRIMAIDI